MGQILNVYKILVRKWPLCRASHRQENIK